MDNIYVILVEPVYKGNVGSVARIMNNFGYCKLRIVGSIPSKEDQIIAVHSNSILEQAEIFDSLASAVSDLDRTIALSRRKGNKKKVDLNPLQLGKYVNELSESNLKLGLVFGRETFGLTDHEAEQCDLRCYIPANEEFPSLNLAQAVAVILYEIYSFSWKTESINQAAEKDLIKHSVEYSLEILNSISFFKNDDDRKSVSDYFYSLLLRSNATKQITLDFKKVFNRIHLCFHGKGKGYKYEKK